MTREEYEAKIDKKLKAVKQELMSEFKEEPNLDGWKKGDIYYYIGNAGVIVEDKFYRGNHGARHRVTHGNAFRTKEEAEFKRERDAVLYELSKYAEPNDREWNKYRHYYITWNYEYNTGVYIDWRCYRKHNDIYFESKEDAEKAIKEVGEERIKKYYLGVEE